MRAFLILLIAATCCHGRDLHEEYRIKSIRSTLKTAQAHPYRMEGTNVVDLNLLAKTYQDYANAHKKDDALDAAIQIGDPKLPDWKLLKGKVVQILGERGILIRVESFADYSNGGIVRVKNHPWQSVFVDGNPVMFFAKRDGVFSYENALGANATIESFDYGQEPTAEQISKIEKISLKLEQLDASIRMDEVQKEKAESEAKKQTKARQIQLKIITFKKEQATNNSPSSQFDLANLYLKGEGVETNKDLAIYWLNRAANNGHSGASNLLQSLK